MVSELAIYLKINDLRINYLLLGRPHDVSVDYFL